MSKNRKREDRRVQKTRESIKRAVIALIVEKDYDSITVQDIIDRANVGRSTFYTHFRDKEDSFRDGWEGFIRFFVDSVDWSGMARRNVVPIAMLLEHLKEFHALYRGLSRSGKMPSVIDYGQKYMAELLVEEFRGLGKTKVPPEYAATYLSVQIFSTIKFWLDSDMRFPPTTVDDAFGELVMPGLRNVFDLAEEEAAKAADRAH